MVDGGKQVRVDNWGIFFLQRLQMFFNKTDYCDLTLQFEGNVQLKVHRLVMNACTEYFHFLEQTCEMIDDVLIMPPDLQSDVVLPIVNFMYTGMLEFQMTIFDKLYKTAELMNITVLTKLLDAQKQPIAPLPKVASKKNSPIPHTWNLQGKKIIAKTSDPDLPATLPGRKLPVWKRTKAPVPVIRPNVQHYFTEQRRSAHNELIGSYDNTPKPTRFEWPEDDLSTLTLFETSFDDISYTSKPLLTQEDEPRPSTSFDEIKHSPSISRRSGNYNNSTVDMEDVKDYVKEQKIRSDLVEDDDSIDNDLESNDDLNQQGQKRKTERIQSTQHKRVCFNENKESQIDIMATGKTDINHTKIISEVLKKYPHLVKKNKNIRLKILAKGTSLLADSSKPQPVIKTTSKMRVQVTSPQSYKSPKAAATESIVKNKEDAVWKCQRCSTPSEPVEFVLYYLYRKHMTDIHNEKFDSRMCKYCGHKSNKHNLLMYHQYTKHGIKPPAAYSFPKCSQCPYIALTETLLIKHKLNHSKFELQCLECKVAFNNRHSLTSHMQITGHTGKPGKTNYDCQYCTKRYQTGANLFSHIKMQHRDEARRDGIVSIDEIEDIDEDELEDEEEENVEYSTTEADMKSDQKIKILSNVKIGGGDGENSQIVQQAIALEPSSEAEALSNVASGIATSLGLVDIVVLDDNQQYILHSNEEQEELTGNQSEFILPDLEDPQNFVSNQQINDVITSEQNVITQTMLNNSDIASTDELVMVLTDHDYGDGNSEIVSNDNSNIVVLYSHPVEGQEGQFITSQGNLLLNQQTGLLELRNGNGVATSTGQQIIIGNAVHSDSSAPIESIEMIQREINSHSELKVENEKSEVVSKSEDTERSVSESEETKDTVEIQAEATNDKEQLKDAEEPMETEDDDFGQGETLVPENSEHVTAENSQNESHEEPELEEAKEQEIISQEDLVSSQDMNSPQDLPSQEDMTLSQEDMALSQEDMALSQEDIALPQEDVALPQEDIALPQEAQNEPELMQVDTAVVINESSKLVQEESKKPEEESDILQAECTEVLEENENANLETEEKLEETEPKGETNQATVEKIVENAPDEILQTDSQSDHSQLQDENSQLQDENSQLQDDSSQLQDDNSQLLQDDNSQSSQTSSNHKDLETSACTARDSNHSAKISILDDWEDTDSQQSGGKSVNTVNKLMDDWADEEEDDENKKNV